LAIANETISNPLLLHAQRVFNHQPLLWTSDRMILVDDEGKLVEDDALYSVQIQTSQMP
jgi:hypothetical protein